jgi:acyl carrier protein
MQEAVREEQADMTGQIHQMWERELGLSDFDDSEDLFDLGATSLHAMRVVSSIAVSYGVEIPLPDFFADPTVAGLSAAVRSQQSGA